MKKRLNWKDLNTKETTYTGFDGKIKNIKQCGQCTKSSCYGCTNYVQGKAQQETASRTIIEELEETLELLKAVGIEVIL